MITSVRQLQAEIDTRRAWGLPLEVYTTSGHKMHVVDAYIEDGVFNLDVEEEASQ